MPPPWALPGLVATTVPRCASTAISGVLPFHLNSGDPSAGRSDIHTNEVSGPNFGAITEAGAIVGAPCVGPRHHRSRVCKRGVRWAPQKPGKSRRFWPGGSPVQKEILFGPWYYGADSSTRLMKLVTISRSASKSTSFTLREGSWRSGDDFKTLRIFFS